jgi:hypothetical protein
MPPATSTPEQTVDELSRALDALDIDEQGEG